MGEDGDTITVELPISAADSLCRAWAGDEEAINSIATQHAINEIDKALSAREEEDGAQSQPA